MGQDQLILHRLAEVEKRLDEHEKRFMPREIFNLYKCRFDEVKDTLKELNRFRWMVLGAVLVIPTIISVAVRLWT